VDIHGHTKENHGYPRLIQSQSVDEPVKIEKIKEPTQKEASINLGKSF
jgi:hypothetical protein